MNKETTITPKRRHPSTTTTNPSSSHHHHLFLLSLPPQNTHLTIDNTTHILARDDFVGISSLPPNNTSSPSCGTFIHLVAIHPRPCTGRLLLFDNNNIINDDDDGDDERRRSSCYRYDPTSDELTDDIDQTTRQNIITSALENRISPPRFIPYDTFVPEERRATWMTLTTYISRRYLKRRGLFFANESRDVVIVPGGGCCDIMGDRRPVDDNNGSGGGGDGGGSMKYPPIPCIDDGRRLFVNRSRHGGTTRYLANLTTVERTRVFMGDVDDGDGGIIMEDVMMRYYDGFWEDMVGDVQLSFLLFLHLGCLTSFEHWRDLLSMLSLCVASSIASRRKLYVAILDVVARQLQSIDSDFFEEIELSDGNFFLPVVKRLHRTCSQCDDREISSKMRRLSTIMSQRFKVHLASTQQNEDSDSNNDNDDDDSDSSSVTSSPACVDDDNDDDDDDDDDDPVIVPLDEIEASLARSSSHQKEQRSSKYQSRYPLLYAAMTPYEDEVMACARILDEKCDVSLVREAASYLEEVEAKRMDEEL